MELCFGAWAFIVGCGCLFLLLRWLLRAARRTAAAAWRATPISEQSRRARQSYALQRASARAHERQQATLDADKNAARADFTAFYTENLADLADDFPPTMCATFFRLQLADHLDPETIWKNVRKQIARLQPIVVKKRELRRAEERRRLESERQRWEQEAQRLREDEQRRRIANRRKLNPEDV